MSLEKNDWTGIFVTCTRGWRAIIKEAAARAGTNPSEWTRQLQEDNLATLLAVGERRMAVMQGLFTLGNSKGIPRGGKVAKPGNATRKKTKSRLAKTGERVRESVPRA